MSIAQVLNLSGGPGAGSAVPEEANKIVEITKALDGCEHIYSMANNQTGDGMAIIVWRDQAAMKAAADHIAADNEALKDTVRIPLSLGPVYDNFMEIGDRIARCKPRGPVGAAGRGVAAFNGRVRPVQSGHSDG